MRDHLTRRGIFITALVLAVFLAGGVLALGVTAGEPAAPAAKAGQRGPTPAPSALTGRPSDPVATLSVTNPNPEAGQSYTLDAVVADPAAAASVAVQRLAGRTWVTVRTLGYHADGHYTLRETASGYGTRYFRALVVGTDGTRSTSARARVTMWDWVHTKDLGRTDRGGQTHDGSFTDAQGALRHGWYAGSWKVADQWFDTYDVNGTCRAFRGAGMVQAGADPDSSVQFTLTHGSATWTSDPVAAGTSIPIRANFPATLTRVTLAATTVRHADGRTGGPAVADSAFLCRTNGEG